MKTMTMIARSFLLLMMIVTLCQGMMKNRDEVWPDGTVVMIKGLENFSEFNGLRARIEAVDEADPENGKVYLEFPYDDATALLTNRGVEDFWIELKFLVRLKYVVPVG